MPRMPNSVMLGKSRANMFLLILLFTFGEAIHDDVSNSDHNSQSFSRLSFPRFYPSCFSEEITWSSQLAVDIVPGIQSVYSCQDLCLQSSNCQKFTWFDPATPLSWTCFLYDDTATTEHPCNHCVSGPQSCTTSSSTTPTSTPTSTPSTTTTTPSTTGTPTTPSTTTSRTQTTTSSTPTTTAITPFFTTTPPHSACLVPKPQNHGDWFCPPSGGPSICHLECDPGYVSNNGTVITCQHGEWSSSPTCVAAVALITGCYSIGYEDSVEVYSKGIHTRLPNLPDHRRMHTLDLVDSTILLCGGYDAPTESSCLKFTSSDQGNPWVLQSSPTTPRSWHSSISALGQLHLLGGQDSLSTSEYLARSSTTWSEGWRLLEGNYQSCAAKVDPEMAIMAGGVKYKSSVISYNVTSGAATRLQDLISPRYRHGCCYIKDEGFRGVLVAGGMGGDTDISQLYDINAGEWSTTGALTEHRGGGVALFVIGDQILASGGYSHWRFGSVDSFNLTSRTWKRTENMLEGRYYHAVTGVPPNALGIGPD